MICQAKEQLAQENITKQDIYGYPEVPLFGSCCSCFHRLEGDRSLSEHFPPAKWWTEIWHLQWTICCQYISANNEIVLDVRLQFAQGCERGEHRTFSNDFPAYLTGTEQARCVLWWWEFYLIFFLFVNFTRVGVYSALWVMFAIGSWLTA